MKKLFLILPFLLLAGLAASAQTTASGKVIDRRGNPVPGARVSIPKSTESTLTELDGTFRIEMPAKAKRLTIDYVGMASKQVRAMDDMTVRLTKSARAHYQGEFGVGYGHLDGSPVGQFLMTTVHGVRFTKNFFFGVGAEINHTFSWDETTFPVFGNIRAYLPVSESCAPYLSASCGYAFGLNRDMTDLYASGELGIEIRSLFLALGWHYQGMNVSQDHPDWGHNGSGLGAFHLKFGFIF